MKKERIVTRQWGDRRKGRTDWARVDALTDKDIEAAIANDPDWQEVKDIDWSDAVLVIPPKKKAISIRVDEDVLDFFKREGDGYQRRINAVLRSYMQQKSKPKKRAYDPHSSFRDGPKGQARNDERMGGESRNDDDPMSARTGPTRCGRASPLASCRHRSTPRPRRRRPARR